MAWPTQAAVQFEQWQPDFAVRSSGRTLGGSGQRILNMSQIWIAQARVVVKPDDARIWNSFVAARQGQFDAFTQGPLTMDVVPDPTNTTVQTAQKAGNISFNFDCVDSALIKKGQVFGLDDRLYIIRSTSIVSGTRITLDIWPPLRAAAAAATAMDATPQTSMRFTDVRFFQYNLDRPDVIPISLEESL